MKTKEIWRFVNDTLMQFYYDFSREKAFRWFVVIVLGLMVGTESVGITSIIRELHINPSNYETMLTFFRANSWKLAVIKRKWMKQVATSGCLYREQNLNILIGDGTKQPKEGKKMPGVKKMHQESEDTSKAAYIYGHFYGVLGILTGRASKIFCTPISATIQDGVSIIRKWEEETYEEVSHVVQMVLDAYESVKIFGSSVLLLDRYFLTVPVLRALAGNRDKKYDLHIVTRAKKNATAFLKPVIAPKATRGRPRKKGDKVKLQDLFANKDNFIETTLTLYGIEEKVQYFCIDLLWGAKLYQELRFVLVCYGNVQAILVSTNLGFTAEQIIRLYGLRSKIEVAFFSIKQVIHGFSSHFWSKAMPKLDHYKKKDEPNPLLQITDVREQKNIINTLKAIEGFALMSCIAVGLLQMISLLFSDRIDSRLIRWLRTVSNNTHSEATIAHFMRKSFYFMFQKPTSFFIIRIIQDKQMTFSDEDELRYA